MPNADPRPMQNPSLYFYTEMIHLIPTLLKMGRFGALAHRPKPRRASPICPDNFFDRDRSNTTSAVARTAYGHLQERPISAMTAA